MNPRLRALLPTLLDIVIPTVGYYVLSALGLSDFWALTVCALATTVWAVITTIRRGRLDGVGTLVVIEIVLSLALLFVTQDPRIVLAKASFYTGVAAVYLLWTCWVGRPLSAETSRPFVTKGDPALERALDRAWEGSGGFRREHLWVTGVWGVLFALAAIVRAVVVLDVPVATGVWAGQIPDIVAFVLGMAYSASRGPALRRWAQAFEETGPVTTPTADAATTTGASCRPGASG